MTDDLIERVAQSMRDAYGVACGEVWVKWTKADESKKNEWRQMARAAIRVIAPAVLEEAAYDLIAAMQADAAPVAWMYERGSERKAYVERSQAALACGYAETPLYAHPPVDDRVSTSSPVDDRAAPKTSGKLRDAVEVWRYASDAATLGSVKYKPAADEAAAAIIEQDREAVRAEQAAELAKFKALAETLAGALEKIGLGFTIELDDEDGPVNVWMDAEELSDLAREALREYKEARDAS